MEQWWVESGHNLVSFAPLLKTLCHLYITSLALKTTNQLELLLGAGGLSLQRMSSLGTGSLSG